MAALAELGSRKSTEALQKPRVIVSLVSKHRLRPRFNPFWSWYKGYKKGKIVQGEKSIRVDGIGYDNASIYLFCSPVSIYILTGHMTGDDDRFWDQLYNNLISLFPRD